MILEFQTNPCGIEAVLASSSRSLSERFRRTLVGLKLDRLAVDDLQAIRFQTNPCGIEAPSSSSRRASIASSFRRTLVGLKLLAVGPLRRRLPGFRRTLVGLKHRSRRVDRRCRWRFRRTLVGLKRTFPRYHAHCMQGFQTNPCGIEARSPDSRASNTRRRFQTSPCGIEAVTRVERCTLHRTFQTNPYGVKTSETSGDDVTTLVSVDRVPESKNARGGLRTHDLRMSQVRGRHDLAGGGGFQGVPHRL